ncbi:MAG: hypothetical protein M1144_00925 [Candidatus Thermoplasmatota archaeon]|nr:hypothetical protein [Candidatus Thermoplasmatota archaeon]MCL5984405.1 hypothetical protein [Candidatus Thermoplasmatota archaeon]
MPRVDLRRAKASAADNLPPGATGREALLAQPDELEAAAFDALFPALVRMLRLRVEGGGTRW